MTSGETFTIALIDDDDDLRTATEQLLVIAGYVVQTFASALEARDAIGPDFAGVVISDVRMPQMSGVELFHILHGRDPDLPVMLISGHADVQMAVDALKSGVWDFIEKPFAPDALLAAVGRAVTARRLCLENRALRRAAQASDAQVIVGETDMIRRLRAMIPVLAQSDIDLAIEGETGTGKELFARCVHRAGPRSRHRFVTIDCAVIPAAVVEKDMFARGGLVAGSHRGTLLLDNLDQASPELQHRLAQLAEKRAIGLDTRDPEAIDVRIIATIAEGRRGHIADQLYHRIAGVPLRMPPLSERRADIRLVFAHLLRQAAERLGCTAPQLEDAIHGLEARAWPGNIRELANFAERCCLGLEDEAQTLLPDRQGTLPERLDAFESVAIRQALQDTKGEIASAITLLGIPRKTFIIV
jgi:two-component system C4-dicarboxylate transport response regulator DctD